MKKSVFLFLSVASLLLYSKPIRLNTPKKSIFNNSMFTIAYKVGTLGLGMDFTYAFNKTFATRLNINGYVDRRKLHYRGEEQRLKSVLHNGGLLFDVHPWQNAFFFSWGTYYLGGNSINAYYIPKSGEIEIGKHKYPSMQVGSVDTIIRHKNKLNPYFGIGFNSMDKNNRWHFVLDIGAIYTDSPQATIKAKAANGFEAIQSILNKESQIEENKLKNRIKKYKIYPVVSVGIGFKF